MKVHKKTGKSFYYFSSMETVCGRLIAIVKNLRFASHWKFTTCKNCLKKRKNKSNGR